MDINKSNNTPTPVSSYGISENDLQRKYGTNWTEKNFQTILNWTFIAAFHIESLEHAISYYRKIIRNNMSKIILNNSNNSSHLNKLGKL